MTTMDEIELSKPPIKQTFNEWTHVAIIIQKQHSILGIFKNKIFTLNTLHLHFTAQKQVSYPFLTEFVIQ
jgi:hypothetical protein